MGGLVDYFPAHAWIAVLALLGVAVVPFFFPPELGMSTGLTFQQYLLLVGFVELAASVGIAVIVIYYRTPIEEKDESEWRFDP